MIDPKTELKHGGGVKISGVWHSVHRTSSIEPLEVIIDGTYILSKSIMSVIEEYKEPELVFEWLDKTESLFADRGETSLQTINRKLTARYGDPTIRTYAGEDAEQYGLTGDSHVLYFDEYVGGDGDAWARSRFKNLDVGAVWRKQPVLPNEKESDHE